MVTLRSAAESAANLFMEEELLVDVLIPSRLRPVPIDDFLPSITRSRRVVVVEEGHLTGGWGAEVSSLIHERAFNNLLAPVIRVASKDLPIPSARTLGGAGTSLCSRHTEVHNERAENWYGVKG